MSQHSLWWPTDGTGDGSLDGYSMDDITRDQGIKWNPAYTDAVLGAGIFDPYGVFFDHLSALAPTIVAGPPDDIRIDTGAAIVHGFLYENDAPVLFRPWNPAGGNTGWVVMLRADWSTRTVRLVLYQSADNVIATVNPTQTAGVVWEIRIATGFVAVGGAITLLADYRRYVDAIIPIIRAWEFIPCLTVTAFGLAENVRYTPAGWPMEQGDISQGYGNWSVPIKATSLGFGQEGITFSAVFTGPIVSGDVRVTNRIQWGADGVQYSAGTAGGGAVIVPYPGDQKIVECCPYAIQGAVPPVVAGASRVSLRFERAAWGVTDTLAGPIYFQGWIAEYLTDYNQFTP